MSEGIWTLIATKGCCFCIVCAWGLIIIWNLANWQLQ